MRPLGNMAWSLLDVLADVERDVGPVCPAAYRDGPPGEGERQIAILRSGVEAGGRLCATGDRINVDTAQAERLVLAGAADYAADIVVEEKENA